MKIGIVTYVKTATCNYGAELQAFALQHKLNHLGYDAEVINLRRTLPGNAKFKKMVKKAIKTRYSQMNIISATYSILFLIHSVIRDKYYARKYRELTIEKKKVFSDFFDTYIRHSTSEYLPYDMDTAELPYDVFIAGSDQIWNYQNSDRVDIFFLMFANRLKAKKISYAASFSVSGIPSIYQTDYIRWINNIDYLGVREIEGTSIIRRLTQREATLVCDPTLLLTGADWIDIFKSHEHPLIQEKYVLIYSMSHSNNIPVIAKDIARKIGNIAVVNIKLNFTPAADNKIIHLDLISPIQWIWLFSHAEYIVTDSFHGTAFSINFNKPFTVVQNPMSDLNSRVNTILTKLNLKSRIYIDQQDKPFPTDLSLDYEKVNDLVDTWRKYSLDFLLKALNSKKR